MEKYKEGSKEYYKALYDKALDNNVRDARRIQELEARVEKLSSDNSLLLLRGKSADFSRACLGAAISANDEDEKALKGEFICEFAKLKVGMDAKLAAMSKEDRRAIEVIEKCFLNKLGDIVKNAMEGK